MKAVPKSRFVLFFTIAIVGFLVDIGTKRYAFDWLGMPGERIQPAWVWPGVFGFQTSLNEGGLFGMGQGMVPVFATFSVLAGLAILYWLFVAGAARDLILTIALGCVMSGVAGNLYDRIGLPGLIWNYDNPPLHVIGEPVHAVRDWILVMIGSYHWPNFNIADSMLVCGAGLLILHAYRQGGAPEEEPASEPVAN